MPIGLLIKLGLSMFFGSMKNVLGFILDHWKPIALLVVICGAAFFSWRYVENAKKAAYAAGVKAEFTRIDKLRKDEDKKNREFETRLQTRLDTFVSNVEKKRGDDRQKETVYQKEIEKTVKEVPVWNSEMCSISDEVLRQRNAIRHLGPKVEVQK